MSLWDRMMFLFGRNRTEPPETVRARELSRSIAEKADALTQHLQNYQRSRDPFAAMMADMYNRDQVERIYLGPPR